MHMSEKENDNRQILVIQDGEEAKPSKWSMRKYGQSIKKYKWWVTGFTVGLALVGLLGVQYVYNASKVSFNAQFSYDLPITMSTDGNGTYIDGTPFRYYDIISEDNLTAVKESDKKFSSINVEKITENGSIEISLNGTTDSTTNVFTPSVPYTYTITGRLKDFGDSSTTKDFVKALIDRTKTTSTTLLSGYSIVNTIPDDATFAALDFDRQVALLSTQYDNVLKVYKALLTTGDTNVVIKGSEDESLAAIKSNYELSYVYGSNSVFTVLSNKLKGESYVNYDTTDPQKTIDILTELGKSDIKSIKENLKSIDLKQDAINRLPTSADVTVGDTAVQQQVATLNMEILDLKTKNYELLDELEELGYSVPSEVTLDNIGNITTDGGDGKIQKLQTVIAGTEEGKAWEKDNAAFKVDVETYKVKLRNDTTKGSEVARYVYGYNRSSVTYVYSGIIKTSGGFSAWIGALAGLVVGFLASSLICCAVYIGKEDETVVTPKAE